MDNQPQASSGFLDKIFKNTDLAFTFGIFGIVVLLIVPVSPIFMDLLLAGSIGCALLILLIVVYVKEPAEFSVFPTILLAITLYRLGLNVASTRLILLDGYAGGVIDSFGNFVVRGNYVVGTVVFLILIVINFVVITKGAGRIAEVAARFTLDAMPGKQMSIDAELNAGIIDESAATKRRTKIQKEADFYGAMDGASKFVRGDAIAGILITLINVVGGIAIGVFQKNLPLMDSLQKYTLLSIGDGLVSQVPALIISVGAGILITRTGEGTPLGEHLGKQIFVHPRALAIAAAMLFLFALMPSMPFAPFASLGVLVGSFAFILNKHDDEIQELTNDETKALEGPQQQTSEAEESKPGSVEDLQKIIQVDTFSIELGYGLLGLADAKASGDLLERVTGVRQKLARELGLVLPPIAVRDNLELETNQYRFLMRNKEIANSELFPARCLAMNISGSTATLSGTPTIEPVFGLEAVWIADEERKTAEMSGFTVVDAPSVLITHLSEVLKDNAHYLLEREDVQKLVDNVKENNATLVNELLPDLVSIGLIQRVLQNLLKENISIKNLTLILETIADFAALTKNPDELSEQVRKVLGVYFAENYESEPGIIKALTLDPRLEQHLINRIQRSQFEVGLMMDPALTESLIHEFSARLKHINEQGLEPILMTTADLRLPFKRFFDPSFPRLNVVAYQELPNQTQVQSLGIIPLPENISPAIPAGTPPASNPA
tara:strand:- start:84934 stop:87099 length:2166 start_codon:yes stop_codon:yes gene_type:complete